MISKMIDNDLKLIIVEDNVKQTPSPQNTNHRLTVRQQKNLNVLFPRYLKNYKSQS